MKRVKAVLLGLSALTALFSVVATSASAAPPTILFTVAGQGVPVTLNSLKDPNTILSELQSGAATLNGEGFLLAATVTNASKTYEGKYEVLFLKVKLGSQLCLTEKEKVEGEVLVPTGTILLVRDLTKTTGVGALFSVPEFTITCGKIVIKIKGNVLGLITTINTVVTPTETDKILANLRCEKTSGGKPAEKKYFINNETEATAQLLSNAGLGFEEGCELIELTSTGTIGLTPSKTIEIMG